MLPVNQLEHVIARRSGRDAAFYGACLDDCPHKRIDLRASWESGWRLGDQDRRHELDRGTHPEQLKEAG